MPFESNAQELIVVEPSEGFPMGGSFIPLEVSETPSHAHSEAMEVAEPSEIEIVIDELPGAPNGTHDPEPLTVELPEEEEKKSDSDSDENEAKKSKKPEKWDWEAHGPHGFVAWIKGRIDDVPKHSGYDSAGLERAISYFERLDNEISRAMRLDLDGELDANKIEAVRSQIDDCISRLHDRLDKVKKHSKSRRKKRSDVEFGGIIKEAQKITGVQGIVIVAPILISRIARVCINGSVSAGHDIEDLYARQVTRWKLTDREQAEVMQLLADMGYPLRQDRGFMPDEDVDFASSDNMDWAANYKG